MRFCKKHWEQLRTVVDAEHTYLGLVATVRSLQVLGLYLPESSRKNDIQEVQLDIEMKSEGCCYCYIGEEKAELMMKRVAEDLLQHKDLNDVKELER